MQAPTFVQGSLERRAANRATDMKYSGQLMCSWPSGGGGGAGCCSHSGRDSRRRARSRGKRFETNRCTNMAMWSDKTTRMMGSIIMNGAVGQRLANWSSWQTQQWSARFFVDTQTAVEHGPSNWYRKISERAPPSATCAPLAPRANFGFSSAVPATESERSRDGDRSKWAM